MYVYLIAALVVVGLVAGAGWKGYDLGQDDARAEFAAERDRARERSEANRKADQDKARKSAQNLQTALARQKALNRDLGTALEAHIRALPAPPDGCPAPTLTPGLLDAWNAGNRAGSGAAGGSLPTGSRAAAGTDRPDDTGDGQEPR